MRSGSKLLGTPPHRSQAPTLGVRGKDFSWGDSSDHLELRGGSSPHPSLSLVWAVWAWLAPAPPCKLPSPPPRPHPLAAGVPRPPPSPRTDTHHIPLLHTIAALNEGGPGGDTAACRGDVTLRPSKDGVGAGLTPFLPIPTVLQGNSCRISASPS